MQLPQLFMIEVQMVILKLVQVLQELPLDGLSQSQRALLLLVLVVGLVSIGMVLMGLYSVIQQDKVWVVEMAEELNKMFNEEINYAFR
jgi:hypothetical protein